jgi:antitoxin component YwqK of YwqJK toxin-antitoxin module
MKKYIVISFSLLSGIFYAQALKPVLEPFGKIVKATYFYENGQVFQEGTFKDGKLHGEWITYDEKGNKTAIAQFDKGQKTGKWFFWNKNSLNEVDYSNNKIAVIKNWKKDAIAIED